MGNKRFKSVHGKYGERSEHIQGKVSPEAKEGLRALAKRAGVSLNEYLELLGRGEISPAVSSGEFSPS